MDKQKWLPIRHPSATIALYAHGLKYPLEKEYYTWQEGSLQGEGIISGIMVKRAGKSFLFFPSDN